MFVGDIKISSQMCSTKPIYALQSMLMQVRMVGYESMSVLNIA